MSVGVAAVGWRLLVTKPRAVVLSVRIGFGGCGWPISSRRLLAGIAWCVLTNRAQISTPAAEVMMLQMSSDIVSTAQLFCGNWTSLDMKSVHLPDSLLLVQ